MAGTNETRGTQRPGLRAYEDSLSLAVPELVDALRALLGARLVAFIGSTNSTSVVSGWTDGSASPPATEVDRLRLLYRIAAMLNERYSPTTIQTWFCGHNPALGDAAPARLLREKQPALVREDLRLRRLKGRRAPVGRELDGVGGAPASPWACRSSCVGAEGRARASGARQSRAPRH